MIRNASQGAATFCHMPGGRRYNATYMKASTRSSPPPAAALRAWRHRGMDCLCGNVRMAARALTTVYDAFLAPTGITASQLAVLWCVVSREPVSMREIAEVLVMDKTTVSRGLAGLLEMGLVAIRTGEADGRKRLASSTAKGRRVFAAALPRWKAAQSWVERRMGSRPFARNVDQAKRLALAVAQSSAA